MIILLLSLVIGYVLGSIPTAHLIVRGARGIDIRNAGSGNVGALNSYLVTRSPFIGICVLLLDFLKGFAAVALTRILFGDDFRAVGAAGIGAILGHNYTVWLKGQGGRGLATAAGALLSITPVMIPVWMVCWGVGYAVVRNVNMGSAIACCLAPLAMAFLPDGIWNHWMTQYDSRLIVNIFLVLSMVVILTKLVRPVMEFLNIQRRL